MSEKVYKNGKTYPNVEELWYAVETFQKLYQSMYTQLIKVLEKELSTELIPRKSSYHFPDTQSLYGSALAHSRMRTNRKQFN